MTSGPSGGTTVTAAPAVAFSEADWEGMALELLAEPLGWRPATGQDIAPGRGERDSWDELLIRPRLLAALQRFNPTVPAQYLQQALAEIASPKSNDAITENHRIHNYLVDGYRLSYIDSDGNEANPTIHLLSSDPDQNDWLAVNQVTLVQGDYKRRFDVVLYCNGMPVSVIELKKAGSATADVASAHAQLQTYLREFPMAFRFCVFTLASDGIQAKYGTPFTPLNHFSPWNVDDDGVPVAPGYMEDGEAVTALETALNGLYNVERFLQLTRNFTAFDEGSDGLSKRIAKPHQYFAVTKAVGSTIQAVESNGKAGVVWHTQGSGKSMEMELYANLVARQPQAEEPHRRRHHGPQRTRRPAVRGLRPEPAAGRKPQADQEALRAPGRTEQPHHRRHLLHHPAEVRPQQVGEGRRRRASAAVRPAQHHRGGGRGAPLPLRRPRRLRPAPARRPAARDADRVHRHADLLRRPQHPGRVRRLHRHLRPLPGGGGRRHGAGVLRAAADQGGAGRRMSRRRPSTRLPTRPPLGLDDTERARIEASVAVVNAVYGAPQRIAALAADLVAHWENRSARMGKFIEAPGKAMIVGGTREICAKLYTAIVELRPDWHSDDLAKGKIKVVYSGTASDVPPVSDHVRRDSLNAAVKERLKDVDDELELVIVKDMMLTGFDAPPLHTLYLDRPLKGALLMQTLARVNRTFRGKEDGLLVAYAPLAENLAKALGEYTQSDRANKPVGKNIDEAVGAARLGWWTPCGGCSPATTGGPC